MDEYVAYKIMLIYNNNNNNKMLVIVLSRFLDKVKYKRFD
jgi:hypothetical protein